uniref:F-box/kelch-repeat protein n=1 Tax=Noccaea caerulescens TaxID=107243 RepID=A0A1J3FU41_NOCCA
MVKGLEGLKRDIFYRTIHLANYGGKLVILWHNVQPLEFPVARKTRKHLCKIKRIWCAVISLEKRIGSSGLEIWGEIERSNAVLTVPYSYKILNCVTL